MQLRCASCILCTETCIHVLLAQRVLVSIIRLIYATLSSETNRRGFASLWIHGCVAQYIKMCCMCSMLDNKFCRSITHFLLCYSRSHTIRNSCGTKGHGLYLLVFAVLIGACCLWPSSQQWPQQRSHLVKSPWKTCLEAKHGAAQMEGRAKWRVGEWAQEHTEDRGGPGITWMMLIC